MKMVQARIFPAEKGSIPEKRVQATIFVVEKGFKPGEVFKP